MQSYFDIQNNGLTDFEADIHCDFWNRAGDLDLQSIRKYLSYLAAKNIEIFPTLVTGDPEKLEYVLDLLLQCDVKGVHIEGGMISKFGVHDPSYARAFDLQLARKWITKYPIKLWTLCPRADLEEHGAGYKMTKFLQEQGVRVSFGHTEASYDEAAKAFSETGVDLVTHWGNAMNLVAAETGFHHRDNPDIKILESFDRKDSGAGLGLYVWDHDEIWAPIIIGRQETSDLHISPHLVSGLLHKRGPKPKVFLTTDSVAYSPQELETGELSLSGGRVSLDLHATYAREDLGLNEEQFWYIASDATRACFTSYV